MTKKSGIKHNYDLGTAVHTFLWGLYEDNAKLREQIIHTCIVKYIFDERENRMHAQRENKMQAEICTPTV